ncbi:diguanylate cyclase [Niveibacterium sp. 24ML]|uniref:tetratricopeptide repeat-containing diguanylate cyclase n=1 Tax=Niveibacterium sp. 24ML TaxID=2985512 RepID=UPI00226FEB15|nr:diguanylate cyclase [Niveibacterium sp. 24ML]MCX9155223.1 diguanylate cyclase [Niveibacterium sp. 24ML]
MLALLAASAAWATDALKLRGKLDDNPYTAASDAVAQAEAARKNGDKQTLLESLTLVAMAYNLIGDSNLTRPALAEALPLATELHDATAEALLHAVDGEMSAVEGDFKTALRAFELALAAAARGGDADAEAIVRAQYGWSLARTMQRHQDAVPHFEAALAQFMKRGDRAREAELRYQSATLYDRLRDIKRGTSERMRSLELVDPAHQAYLAATIYYELGAVERSRENRGDAERALRMSIELSRRIGDDMGVAFAESELAPLLLEQGNPREAATLLKQARPVLEAGQNTIAVARTDARLAHALALQHDPAAWPALASAKATLLATGTTEDEAIYWRTDALVNAAFGRFEAAYAANERVLRTQRIQFDSRQAQALSELTVRFETQRREAENKQLRLTQQLNDATIATQRARQLALAGGLAAAVIALISGVVLLRRQVALKQQFKVLALQDELTGAPNRRAIMQFAEVIIARPSGEGDNAVIALLDLDHFKQINDSFGHDVGDAVLRGFYKAAASAIRPDDMLGRAGGEEWLLVMPVAPPGAEESVFERMRTAVAGMHAAGLPSGHRVAFSMGVARVRKGEGLTHALRRADLALYEAKQAGRDRLAKAD